MQDGLRQGSCVTGSSVTVWRDIWMPSVQSNPEARKWGRANWIQPFADSQGQVNLVDEKKVTECSRLVSTTNPEAIDNGITAVTEHDQGKRAKHVKDATNHTNRTTMAQRYNLVTQLGHNLPNVMAKDVQVSEAYGPPRVADIANKMGF